MPNDTDHRYDDFEMMAFDASYLQPRMGTIGVTEPVTYRSLYFVDSARHWHERRGHRGEFDLPEGHGLAALRHSVLARHHAAATVAQEQAASDAARADLDQAKAAGKDTAALEHAEQAAQRRLAAARQELGFADTALVRGMIASDFAHNRGSDKDLPASLLPVLGDLLQACIKHQQASADLEKAEKDRQTDESDWRAFQAGLKEYERTARIAVAAFLAGKEITDALDPFGPEVKLEAHHPAVGVLMVHRQAWEQKGLALGNLLHSVCLAPGEVTQVAIIDWTRRTTGTSTETAEQREEVSNQAEQTRAVQEAQRATAQELQRGGSTTASASVSAQAAISGGGPFVSGSASLAATASGAMSAQFSTGQRELGAEATNAVTALTAEKSQSLRSRRASVVREVREEEREGLTARVLANYNRRHSLNIEYFEVLQLYAIRTSLVEWERCLFVPMKLIDLDTLQGLEAVLPELERVLQPGARARLRREYHDWRDVADVKAGNARAKAARLRLEQELGQLRHFTTVNAQAAPEAAAVMQHIVQAAGAIAACRSALRSQLEANARVEQLAHEVQQASGDARAAKERELHDARRTIIARQADYSAAATRAQPVLRDISRAFGALLGAVKAASFAELSDPMLEKHVEAPPAILSLRELTDGSSDADIAAMRDAVGPLSRALQEQAAHILERIAETERRLRNIGGTDATPTQVEALEEPPRPFIRLLAADALAISQAVWLHMDRYRLHRLLHSRTLHGETISSLIDPQPVGVFGNYLAFRWGFARTDAGARERRAFEQEYLKLPQVAPEDASGGALYQERRGTLVALPTSGVFAEAVLGRAEAAEEIDESRFWRWNEEPIPILPPKIAEIASRDRSKGMDLASRDFAASLAALRATPLGDYSHIGQVLGQVGRGDMFRNMGGLEQTASLAEKVAALSASGATEAGKRQAELHGKILDTFEKMLDGDVGKAIVAQYMVPGAGSVVLNAARSGLGGGNGAATGSGSGDDLFSKHAAIITDKSPGAPPAPTRPPNA